jgi:cytochrome c553
MLAVCRLDGRKKSSAFVSEELVSPASLGTAHPTRLALVVIALALSFSPYAHAANVPDTYKAHCLACHGANGAGDTMIGKNLKLRPLGSAEVQSQSDDELFAIINKGKGKGRMPAFDRKLSKDQIRDLVRYIRSLKK